MSMLDFFKREPQKQYNTAYIMPDRLPFDYEAVSRQDRSNLTFSTNWEINTDTILIKTLNTDYTFKKNEQILVHTKPYMVDAIYTDDEDVDLNSEMFQSTRTYTYISLRY